MTFITPAAAELDRFATILDKLDLHPDARRRLYNMTYGADFEAERRVAWAAGWMLKIIPPTPTTVARSLKALVLMHNPQLTHGDIPTAAQIIHALQCEAEAKENA